MIAVFQDLDAMAGVISGKHVGEGTTIVTAACDRVSIENPLREICDLEYSGSVTYASGKLETVVARHIEY